MVQHSLRSQDRSRSEENPILKLLKNNGEANVMVIWPASRDEHRIWNTNVVSGPNVGWPRKYHYLCGWPLRRHDECISPLWLRMKADKGEKITRLNALKNNSFVVRWIKRIAWFDTVYRIKQDNNPLGYDVIAVSRFIMLCAVNIQKEEKAQSGNTRVDARRVHEISPKKSLRADYAKVWLRDLLWYHELLSPTLLRPSYKVFSTAYQLMVFKWFKAGDGGKHNIVISGVKKLGTYEQLDDGYSTEFDVKPAKLSELVVEHNLEQRIVRNFQEG